MDWQPIYHGFIEIIRFISPWFFDPGYIKNIPFITSDLFFACFLAYTLVYALLLVVEAMSFAYRSRKIKKLLLIRIKKPPAFWIRHICILILLATAVAVLHICRT